MVIIYIDQSSPKGWVHGLEYTVSMVYVYIIAFNFMCLLIKSVLNIMIPGYLLEYTLCKHFRRQLVIPIKVVNAYVL